MEVKGSNTERNQKHKLSIIMVHHRCLKAVNEQAPHITRPFINWH